MMKLRINKLSKSTLFLFISFLSLFLNYSVNLFKVASFEDFYNFDKFSEAFVMGKLARSKSKGIFTDGGLTGYNYNKDSVNEASILENEYPMQLEYFLEERPLPPDYKTYESQTGGQALMYSVVDEVLPLDSRINFRIFKLINAFLVALSFTMFIGWAYRNFGIMSSFILLILIIVSPWLVSFGHNLWWALWSFYLPFLALLLLLEKRNKGKSISNRKLFFYVFLMVFLKSFFTGFEFISTTLLMIICPVVYYYFIECRSLKEFILFSLKIGITAVIAVVTEMVLLIMQIRVLKGSLSAGIDYIIKTYTRRVEFNGDGDFKGLEQPALFETISQYLQGNAFNIGFADSQFHFVFLILTIVILGSVLVVLSKKKADRRMIKALVLTTAFSVLCPLSWFIIFKQHAAVHLHLDYIVWYMPFLLFGYLIIGQSVSMIFNQIKK